MELGSQRLYQDAREAEGDDIAVAERIELPVEEVEIPTVLPPTLDKLIHGHDTFPNEDDGWLVSPPEPDEPPKEAKRAEKRRVKKAKNPVNRREITAISLETAGMIAISAGFWLIHPWCGLISLGLCLILIGVAISRGHGSA